MRIKKLLAFFLSMSFIVCSLPTLVSADEVDGAGAADDPVVEDVGGSSDPEVAAGAPADVKQGENGSGDVKEGSTDVSGAPVVGGQNDNDGGSGDPVYSGTCGEGVEWTYDPGSKTLSISGTGDMDNYSDYQEAPWADFRDEITSVIIGYGIINIGNMSFFYCKNLISVTISETVTRIGTGAFYDCSSLKDLTIPSSVMTIDHHAFAYTGLKEITIPESATNIGFYLFYGCKDLTRIECLPAPDHLDTSAFDSIAKTTYVYVPHKYFDLYCVLFSKLGDQLVDIDFDGDTTPTSSPTGAPINTDTPITGTPVREIKASGNCGMGVNWILYKDGELYIYGSGSMDDYSYTGINSIPWKNYFEFITTIKITDQVDKIGSYAFSNLMNLKTVTIPANIKTVGGYAFTECSNLTDIYCYSDPGSFSGNAFDFIGADATIIHVKTRYCTKYGSKYGSIYLLHIIDDLSYVDILGNNVVLSDQIGVNFYLDYSKEFDISDLSVEFKWGSGSNAKTVSGTLSQDTSYGAKCVTSCCVPARCMTDSIKMTVKKGDDIVISSTFKIAKYANDLAELYPAVNVDTSDYIGLEKNGKLHTLLIAMLNYGAECQKYFNYNTDDLANAKKYTKNLVKVGSVSSSTKSAYSNYDEAKTGLIDAKNTIANIGDDNIGLAYDGSAVACKSKLSVRIYFTKTEGFDISNLSASYKGKALTFKESGDSVYIEIDGMSPKAYAPKGSDLFDCGLTININGKDYTYTYLDYVQKCVTTENGFEDTAVALAVYSYFAANY